MSKENYNPWKVGKAGMARTLGDLETMIDDGVKVPNTAFGSVKQNLIWITERLEPTEQLVNDMVEMSKTGLCNGVKMNETTRDWVADWMAALKILNESRNDKQRI